jgi:hypothetical protein
MADVFSSLVVWRGVVVAEAPADEDHPYGHGKAEPIAAAVVSAMLLIAATWIVIGAFRAIVEPHEAPRPFTLIVLVAVISCARRFPWIAPWWPRMRGIIAVTPSRPLRRRWASSFRWPVERDLNLRMIGPPSQRHV